jgi:hypothetical protein
MIQKRRDTMNIDLDNDLYNTKQIEDLVSYLVNIYKLNNYIKVLNITFKSHLNTIATYFPTKKELNLYLKAIDYSSYNLSYFINESNIKRNSNLYLLQTILHELTHAKQTKLSEENINDSLHILITEGIELGSRCPTNLTIREKVLYTFCHDLILTEKNANCESVKNIIELDNKENFLTNNELIYLENLQEKYLNKGYTKTSSAAKNYYNLRGKVKEYKKIPFNEDYDDYTKRSWGMPLK